MRTSGSLLGTQYHLVFCRNCAGGKGLVNSDTEQKKSGHAPSCYILGCLAGEKQWGRKQGLSWVNSLQGTWQEADTWPGAHTWSVRHQSAAPRSLWSTPIPAGGDGEAGGRGAGETSGVRAPPGEHLGRLLRALCWSKEGEAVPKSAGAQILPTLPRAEALNKDSLK